MLLERQLRTALPLPCLDSRKVVRTCFLSGYIVCDERKKKKMIVAEVFEGCEE